jgi:hypothetical protein
VDATNRFERLVKTLFLFSALTLIVTGCGGGGNSGGLSASGTATTASKKPRIHGTAHGGQNPVVGATVDFYAAGTSGSDTQTLLGTTTTDNKGDFEFTSLTPCSGVDLFEVVGEYPIDYSYEEIFSPNTYLVATGGDSGNGPNSAIALMAPLGTCDEVENSTTTTVVINELTTVAGEWSLQQFTDSSGQHIGSADTDDVGVANGFLTAGNLEDISATDSSVSGEPSSFLPDAAQCGSVMPPVNCDGLLRLNTLADMIGACVNSSGPDSTACATLLCDAIPGALYSAGSCSTTSLTDTLMAAHSVAQNPENNVLPLFGLVAPNAPFEPTLASQPDGFEIALNYAPAAAELDGPAALAFDASGNLFVANSGNSTVAEFPASGMYRDASVLAAAGVTLDQPSAMAFDSSGNLFVANASGNSVSEFQAPDFTTGVQIAPTPAGFASPSALALDSSNNLFVANLDGGTDTAGSVTELTESSGYSTGAVFDNTSDSGAGFNNPTSLALDSSQNVFVTNAAGNSVTELTSTSSYLSASNFNNSNTTPSPSFDNPLELALDSSSNIFAINELGSSVSLLFAPSYGTSTNFDNTTRPSANFNHPFGFALDGLGNVFVANGTGNSVTELTEPNSYAGALNFSPAGAGFDGPAATAIDGSGNVFIANFTGKTITQLIGLAVPAKSETISAGPATVAILVFLCLLGVWYGRKFIISTRRRHA